VKLRTGSIGLAFFKEMVDMQGWVERLKAQ
jgi:hypothetical protein